MGIKPATRHILYVLIAFAALVCAGAQLKPYLALGLVGGNVQFWQDTLSTASSRFITIDIMFVFLVVWWWMLTEARRLKMRGVGWYFLASLLVAFSTALPVFMLHREWAQQRMGADAASGETGALGILSLVLVAAVTLTYAGFAFMHAAPLTR